MSNLNALRVIANPNTRKSVQDRSLSRQTEESIAMTNASDSEDVDLSRAEEWATADRDYDRLSLIGPLV